MHLSQETLYLLIGALIGLSSSSIGALIDYLLTKKRNNQKESILPGCVLLVSGMLGLIGLCFTVTTFFLTGGLKLALLSGLGVLGGFTIAFMLLSLGWLLFADHAPSKEFLQKKDSPTKPAAND
jgi:hypothetical protein